MYCSVCKGKDVAWVDLMQVWYCKHCNRAVEVEQGEDDKLSMQIFFSYGHDTHQEFVQKLAEAIMRKTDGRIKVWIDTRDISVYSHWRERITDGILNSRSVLAFLSKYSAREKGVCLDELAIALSSKHGMIKTVLLENSNPKDPEGFTPPALVTEYQWADMSNYKEFADKGEEAFAEYVDMQAERVIAMLDSDEVTKYNNELSLLRKKLALPEISYEQPRLNRLLKTPLVGRVWLTDMVNAWIEDADAKPVLMLYGKPGAGKSMFSAHLQHYNPHVAASFACNHQSDEFSNTDNIITWLAYKLAMRLPDYRRQLLKLFDDPHFDTGTRRDRFDRLIAQPLSLCINGERGTMMIIIDALDEAKGDEMAGFISEYTSLLPPWLRILITARKEPHITERFKIYPHIDLAEESENNEADIREYYELHLHDLLDRQSDREAALQRLLHASEGVFLYAEEICPILLEEAKKGDLDLLTSDLPQGMDNLFHFSMKRKDFTYHKDGLTYHYTDFWRDPLGMIVAAPSPLPVETLKTLMGWDENDLHTFRLPLSALLTETDGCLQTFHRSFGEWLDKTGEFHSSTQDGLVNLANRAFAVYQTGVDNLDEYLLCNLTSLLRKANLQDEYNIAIADDVLIDAMDDKAHELIEHSQLEAALLLSEELVCIFENDTSEKGRHNYSVALNRLGRVLEIMNAFARAAQVFNKALQTDRKLTADFPENPEYRHGLSVSLGRIADILQAQNEWDEALERYNESLEIFRKLTADFPENPQYRCDMSISLNMVANILKAQNEWDEALKYYNESLEIAKKLTADFPENPQYRRDLSISLANVAGILQAQNKWDEALKLYNESLEIRRKLTADFPENPDYRHGLSISLASVADILQAQNELDEALKLFNESLEIFRKLAADFPENPRYRRDLSISLERIADILQAQNEIDEALKCYNKSLEILRELANAYPENPDYRRGQTIPFERIADILKAQNEWDEALKYCNESLKIWRELANAYPENPEYRSGLSVSLNNVADILQAQNEWDEALKYYNESLKIWRELANAYPENPEYRCDLSVPLINIADILQAQNDLAEALKYYNESLEILRELANAYPENPDYRRGQTIPLERIADILKAQNELDEALKYYNKSLEIFRKLVADFPENPAYRRDLLVSFAKVADILQAQNKLDEALGLYNESLEIFRKLAADFPEHPGYRRDLSVSLNRVADILQAQNRLDEALKYYNESLEIRRKLAADFLENPEYRRDLSVSLNRVAGILQAQNKIDKALKYCNESLEIARKLVADFPENPLYRRGLSVSLINVAGILQAQNMPDEALKYYNESLEIRKKLVADFPQNLQYRRDLQYVQNRISDLQKKPAAGKFWSKLKKFFGV